MKLVNFKGNANHAKWYTGEGADKQEERIDVGPAVVDLPEDKGRYMLNLFGKELTIVRDQGTEPEVVQELHTDDGGGSGKAETTTAKTADINFEPGGGNESKQPPPVDANQYFCSKCQRVHMKEGSKIGESHREHAVSV